MIKIQSQQILIPKQVYIGDRAELRVSFAFNSELESETLQKTLSTEFFEGSLNSNDYEIKSIMLDYTGQKTCSLKITFIPWKTGLIQFPEYNLTRALDSSISRNFSKETDIGLNFEPLEIISLIESGEKTLKSSAAPMLLPGTMYGIYAQIIAAILLIILIIRLIIKHKSIKLFFMNQKLLRKYKKNRRLTEKKLKALDDSKISDHECAEKIQKIMRTYLEVRLEAPFTHTITSELTPLFYKISQGLLPEEKENAFFEIVSTFVRTDYIRYSKEAEFLDGERKGLISKLLENINIMEEKAKKHTEEEKDADIQ